MHIMIRSPMGRATMKYLLALIFIILGIRAEITSVSELTDIILKAGEEGARPPPPENTPQLTVKKLLEEEAAANLSRQRIKFATIIRDAPLQVISQYLTEPNIALMQLEEAQKKILANSVQAETFDLACKSKDFQKCLLVLDYIDTQLSGYSIQKHWYNLLLNVPNCVV